jgi:hypothetical protein
MPRRAKEKPASVAGLDLEPTIGFREAAFFIGGATEKWN